MSDNYEEKEVSSASEAKSPFSLKGIGRRIEEVADMVGGKKKLADISGISVSHLYRLMSGDSDPSATKLFAISENAGVNLTWLITGKGTARGTSSTDAGSIARAQSLDIRALEEVFKLSRAAEDAQEVRLSAVAQARVIRVLYDWAQSNKVLPSPDLVNAVVAAQAGSDKWKP
jgi:transcriptional regulator with XRE-family HTH domain